MTRNDLWTPTDREIADAFGVEDVDDITDDMLDDVDVPDLPDTLDVSDYATASGAAKAVARHLRHYADDDEQVRVERVRAGMWLVEWEGGSPYEWAPSLTGGESIYWAEFLGSGMGTGDPQVVGFYENDDVAVECQNSFTLSFFDESSH